MRLLFYLILKFGKPGLIKKVDVDTRAAKIQICGMINENRKRLDEFDDHDREDICEDDLDDPD